MRILFLGRSDWANVSHRVAAGMNAAAGETIARVLVLEPHPFGYAEDMVIGEPSSGGWRKWGHACDWLISTGDGEYKAFFALAGEVGTLGQRRATAHVGSAYRNAPGEFNDADDLLRWDRRFIGGDLFRFALADPLARPYFAPPGEIHAGPLAPVGERIRIGHSPSNRAKKGTTAIAEVLEDLACSAWGPQVELDIIEGVSYAEAARRRARCHVFVDQLVPEIGGYGASAVEAMAAGCAVLADIRHVCGEVDAFYPRPPIIHVWNAAELAGGLRALVRDRQALERQRLSCLAWARAFASPAAVGRYWLAQLV